jgi:hypothetical protein
MGKRVLGGKPEGKSPPGRPTRRRKVIMDFKGVKWIYLAPSRVKLGWGVGVVDMAVKFRFQKRGEFS